MSQPTPEDVVTALRRDVVAAHGLDPSIADRLRGETREEVQADLEAFARDVVAHYDGQAAEDAQEAEGAAPDVWFYSEEQAEADRIARVQARANDTGQGARLSPTFRQAPDYNEALRAGFAGRPRRGSRSARAVGR